MPQGCTSAKVGDLSSANVCDTELCECCERLSIKRAATHRTSLGRRNPQEFSEILRKKYWAARSQFPNSVPAGCKPRPPGEIYSIFINELFQTVESDSKQRAVESPCTPVAPFPAMQPTLTSGEGRHAHSVFALDARYVFDPDFDVLARNIRELDETRWLGRSGLIFGHILRAVLQGHHCG
ncbi:hypothetical protein D3C86_1620890 [compost metagenome]